MECEKGGTQFDPEPVSSFCEPHAPLKDLNFKRKLVYIWICICIIWIYLLFFPPAEEFERGNETKGDEATPGENDDSGRNGLHEEHSRGSSDNETADDEDDGHRKFGHKEHSKKAPEGDEGAKAQDPFSNETNLGHRPFNGSELDHHGGYAPKLE